jgi:hypothetical protein
MDTTPQTAAAANTASQAPPVGTGPVVKRSPALAVVLSMLPGLGHLYVGLYRRGIAFFAAFALSLTLANSRHGSLGVIIAFVWFFTLIDAFRCAQAINLGQATAGIPQELASPTALRVGNLGFGVLLLLVGAVLLYNQFYPLDLAFFEDWWPLAIVLFGAWVIGKHFFEQRRRRALQELPEGA